MPESPPSQGLLSEAQELIHGPRQQDYGAWDENFGDLAVVWSMYLQRRGLLVEGKVLGPADTTVMHAIAKVVREFHAHKRDNLVDGAGYLAITDELLHRA